MMTANLIHCVCGPISAGKSTLARRLADDTRGVRFAIEFMEARYETPSASESLNLACSISNTGD